MAKGRRRGGYIPHRIVLLERFGAAFYTYLFRHAQGAKRDASWRRAVEEARRYIRAGGTAAGVRNAAELAQQQTHDVIEAWYGEAAVRGYGRTGPMIERLVEAVEQR
ncbi:MAG TPA: hypothetical protein VIY27_08295 [Myxococcota bacterium]